MTILREGVIDPFGPRVIDRPTEAKSLGRGFDWQEFQQSDALFRPIRPVKVRRERF